MIRLTIPGKPVSKRTGQISTHGRYPRLIKNADTVQFENLVRLEAVSAGYQPLEGPLRVTIDAYWPSKGPPRKTPRPREWKPTKPDSDNLSKSILDGLEGVCFLNDAAVVDLRVRKWHAAQGEMPRTEIEIEEVA